MVTSSESVKMLKQTGDPILSALILTHWVELSGKVRMMMSPPFPSLEVERSVVMLWLTTVYTILSSDPMTCTCALSPVQRNGARSVTAKDGIGVTQFTVTRLESPLTP